MPDIVDALADGHGLSRNREGLIAHTDGENITTDEGIFRVSNLPLFRDIDGVSHQAIRVWVGTGYDRPPAHVRLRVGATMIGEAPVQVERQAPSLCLVPEVTDNLETIVEILRDDAVIGAAPFTIAPQRKWTIHLVHHSHYDIGYTDPQAKVLESQLTFLDSALELADLTDSWPDAARFRWNIEVTWPLKHWLRTRPASARDAFVRRVREGRFEVHALPFSMHTESFSFDELARQLEYMQELRDSLGIEIVSAMQTDVPGATVGLATLLTDAGIRYFCVSHNYAGRSIPHLLDGQELTRPFRWAAPDGEELLVWHGDTLHGAAYMEAMNLGFGIGVNTVEAGLPEYLNALAQLPYPYLDTLDEVKLTRTPYQFDVLNLRVQGAIADNACPSLMPSTITREWNERWTWPKLHTSTDRAFFEELETRIDGRDDILTFHGDWTNWWADGIGSGAFALGKNRQSQRGITTAQTLHAIADAMLDTPNPAIAADVTAAYEEMALFDEHTWGAANPWDADQEGTGSGAYEWQRKIGFAWSAEERVTTLLAGGLQRCSLIGSRAEGPRIAVFNLESWERTDLAKVFVSEATLQIGSFRLVDLGTDEEIAYVLTDPDNAGHRPRGKFIEFLARRVPQVGYAMFALEPGTPISEPAPASLRASDTTIANPHLQLDFDLPHPAPTSLIERGSGTQIRAAGSPFGINEYIYDRYTSAPGFNHLSSRIGKVGPWLLGSRRTGEHGFGLTHERSELWDRITIRYAGDGCAWLESTYTMVTGVPRLDIRNRYLKPAVMDKESVFWAFPFDGTGEPTIEITGGVAGPQREHVPGSAQHFRAMRHWATIARAGANPLAWATREAPLLQVGNIHLPYAPFPRTIGEDKVHPTTLFSWAMNNIWDTNFPPQQGGEFTNHYSIGLNLGESALATGMETGAAVSSSFVGVCVTGQRRQTERPPRGSFVEVDEPQVFVNHVKSLGDGRITVMLENKGDRETTTRVTTPAFAIDDVSTATFLGMDPEPLEWGDNGGIVRLGAGELRSLILTIAR